MLDRKPTGAIQNSVKPASEVVETTAKEVTTKYSFEELGVLLNGTDDHKKMKILSTKYLQEAARIQPGISRL